MRKAETQLRMNNKQAQPARTLRFTKAQRKGKHSLPRCRLRGSRAALVPVSDPFQNRADNQRQRHRSIIQHFRKPSAFLQRNKFSPRYRLGVSAPRKPAPIHRLRANSQPIVITLQRNLLVPAPCQQFRIHTKLLRPIPRHAAANRKNSHALRLQHRSRVMLEIQKRIKSQRRLPFHLPLSLVQSKINPQFGIRERRNKNRHIMLDARFQNPAPLRCVARYSPIR